MERLTYMYGRCSLCSGGIEFPSHSQGDETTCPHCGRLTELSALPAPPKIRRRPAAKNSIAVVICLIIATAIAGWFYAGFTGALGPIESDPKSSAGYPPIVPAPPTPGLYDGWGVDPTDPIPELGLSREQIANSREWLAAGAPREWKGIDLGIGMTESEWKSFRTAAARAIEHIEWMRWRIRNPSNSHDADAELWKKLEQVAISRKDVDNLWDWLADGAPKYWRGRDQFPEMSLDTWERWRNLVRQREMELERQSPK